MVGKWSIFSRMAEDSGELLLDGYTPTESDKSILGRVEEIFRVH